MWKDHEKQRHMVKMERRKDGQRGEKKEQNHLVKHFTVKSSSDLSTLFSVCLSSDNWKVVSVCTEPRGDRKHFLAGLDRLDNGRKKKNKCCQETIARGLQEDCSAYVCVCMHTCG